MMINIVSCEYNDDVAIVRVEYPCADGEVVEASGAARRHRDDRPNPELGVDLATARALRNLGSKMERRTMGQVKHADDVRSMRAAARKKRKRQEAARKAVATRKARKETAA